MRIFERRVPLTEGQRKEVGENVVTAGKVELVSVVGEREKMFESKAREELEVAVQEFLARVMERAGRREFFDVAERQELVERLSVKIEAVLHELEEQDKRRLASFVEDEPQSVEATLRSFDEDLARLEGELEAGPDERDAEELRATRDDLRFFRDGLWRQVQLGHMKLEDFMSSEEKQSFVQDVELLGERAGVAQTGKSAAELSVKAAEAMVDEYHRMLAAHKILLALEASYSEEELRAHLEEAVPEGISIDVEGLWREMNVRHEGEKPDELSKLRLYGRIMAELFKDHKLMAAGLSGGTVLLGYLAPQMAGKFGDFGRSGNMGDAVEGAGFGMASALAQVELSRHMSLFLNERLYAESGLASKIMEAVVRSSPDLFTRKDRAMLRQYVTDAVESVGSVAHHTIEGLGTHLAQTIGLAAASVTRLRNPALFGPVVLAAGINTFLAKRADKVVPEAHNDVREASAQLIKRLDEAMEVRATRGGGRTVESEVVARLKDAQNALVTTVAKYQQGGGLVMPLVLLLNAMLMDRSRPDFFADYAEGSMYSMQLSQSLASLTQAVARIGQAVDPIRRLSELTREFHEGGHVMPESWDVEFTDVRYKKLSIPSLRVTPGELVTVVGETGAGKSRMLELLYGFTPDRGLVLIDDVPKSDVAMRAYRDGIAVANQFFATETASFIDNITGADLPYDAEAFTAVVEAYGFEAWMRQVAKADASESLESVGRRLVLNKDAELSGGELKKFSLLSIDYRLRVAPDTVKMILLDEPTSGADNRLKESLFRMIAKWREEYPDKTIVIVNHDPALFPHLPDDSRVLGIEKDGALSQDETLQSAREHEGSPFHTIFGTTNATQRGRP